MIFLPTSTSIHKAVGLLQEGNLMGLPTETVYGLAGDASQDLAVSKIFEQKKRPTFNPLIIHGPSQDAFKAHVFWNAKAQDLAEAFWPGPLTLILPRLPSSSLSLLASAGLDSLAIRVPNHPVALDLLKTCGKLLAAPSANISGKVSPTQAAHVKEDFPSLFTLDGGEACIGVESTIVDLTLPSPHLLRPGKISKEEIESIIGSVEVPLQNSIKAPGMMKSHYAPKLPLRLNVLHPQENEAYLAFGAISFKGKNVLNLSPSGDVTEAASNLFKMIRELDRPPCQGMAVSPIPLEGLGVAINDRLERAAAPRAL